jgi:hypothetical protein
MKKRRREQARLTLAMLRHLEVHAVHYHQHLRGEEEEEQEEEEQEQAMFLRISIMRYVTEEAVVVEEEEREA